MPEKINKEIIQNYDLYKKVKRATKRLKSEQIVLVENLNHKVGNEKTEPVTSSELTDIDLKIMADKSILGRYQFHLRSKSICQQPFFRFDASGLTHRNKSSNTPLSLQQVTTPHFQYYDETGVNTAYKTEELKDTTSIDKILTDINYGMSLFCNESITFTERNNVPNIIRNGGEIFPVVELDPLNNIKFE